MPELFPHLRAGQRKAFDLLWTMPQAICGGCPALGKTTTLGALLASCVVQKPDLRILLVASTNQAVDQALVAVDKALEQLGQNIRDCATGCAALAVDSLQNTTPTATI